MDVRGPSYTGLGFRVFCFGFSVWISGGPTYPRMLGLKKFVGFKSSKISGLLRLGVPGSRVHVGPASQAGPLVKKVTIGFRV